MTPEERFDEHDKRMTRIEADLEILASYTLKHEKLLGDLTAKMLELAESQKEGSERLNVLIGVVERYFTDDGRKA